MTFPASIRGLVVRAKQFISSRQANRCRIRRIDQTNRICRLRDRPKEAGASKEREQYLRRNQNHPKEEQHPQKINRHGKNQKAPIENQRKKKKPKKI
jgi:hypothetical protein